MAEFEEKFFVVNRKYLKRISPIYIDKILARLRIMTRYNPDNKYYVCNQDEPYADKVLQVILAGEDKKINQRSKTWKNPTLTIF